MKRSIKSRVFAALCLGLVLCLGLGRAMSFAEEEAGTAALVTPEPTAEETAEADPTAEPTEEIAAESEEEAAEDPAEEPAEEAEEFVPCYAAVSAGTVLYSDKACTSKLGTLRESAVMLVYEAAENVYEAYFVTEDSQAEGAVVRAYFRCANPDFLSESETEAQRDKAGRGTVDGIAIFFAEVELAKAAEEPTGEPTEEPTEEPTGEPTEEPTAEPTAEPTEEPTAEPLPTEAPLEEEPLPTEEPLEAEESYDAETEEEPEEDAEDASGEDADVSGESSQEDPVDEPLRMVVVTVSADTEEVRVGSEVTLTATLTGFDDVSYTCRWQYAETDSEGNVTGEWQSADIGELSFTYTLTEDNDRTAWRMCVTVDAAEDAALPD